MLRGGLLFCLGLLLCLGFLLRSFLFCRLLRCGFFLDLLHLCCIKTNAKNNIFIAFTIKDGGSSSRSEKIIAFCCFAIYKSNLIVSCSKISSTFLTRYNGILF